MFGTKWPSMTSTWIRSAPPRSATRDRVAERGEIGGEQRRRDLQVPGGLHQRLTSSEIGSPGADLESALRALAQHDAGGHARIRMIADDRHAEAARAQQIRGAIAVDADQVGHHVGRRRARRD